MTPRCYSGQYIVKKWEIEGFHLFDLLNAGVQAYTGTGLNVVNRDPLLRKQYTLEYLEEDEWKIEQLQRGTDESGIVMTDYSWRISNRDKRTQLSRIETNKIARREWEKQPKTFFTDPEGCISVSYSLDDKIEPRREAIARAKNFIYPSDAVCEYFENKKNHAAGANTKEQTDPETFIRSVQISYLSDTEIKIKVGDKKSKTYSHVDLGFQREKTQSWRALIQILKSPDHLYHVGVAHGRGKVRNKSYDAKRNILREIRKKLVSFLNNTHKMQLPNKFQIFEIVKSDPPGTYRPKFTIPNFSTEDAHYDSYSKDVLIAEIENLSASKAALKNHGDEDSEKKLCRTGEKLDAAITVAIKKNWLGQNRAASYLNPPTED